MPCIFSDFTDTMVGDLIGRVLENEGNRMLPDNQSPANLK
jgi:hypothetical protein